MIQDKDLFKQLQQQIKEFGQTYIDFKEEDLFTLWFLRAYITEKEDEAAHAVVNGANDKGIDAIYIDDNARAVFIIQAKYRKQLGKGSEKSADVKQLAEIGHRLGRDDLASFKTFVENADPLVKERLIQARQKIEKRDYKLWLYYVTLGTCSPSIRKECQSITKNSGINCSMEVIDAKRVMLLYRDYLDGVAPPIPTLDLEMEKGQGITVNGVMQRYDEPGKIESWAFSMQGSDMASVYEASGIRLFARNIRGFLGKQTNVNSSMQATLEEEPERFFYYNNGITIICDSAERISHKGRDILRVNNPQIINGQQTTRTLAMFPTYASKASVLVKVIQVPRDVQDRTNQFETLISAIVHGTNWQNPVKQSDLIVNDRKQIEIEREFRKIGYLYLRKRQGKAEAKRAVNVKYLKTIKKEEIARAVAASEMDPIVLRLGIEKLFSEERYDTTFPNTDPNYYLPKYWLMWHVNKVSKKHEQGGFSKWLVLNFVWSQFSPIVRSSSKAVAFRKLCESRNETLYNNLHKAIDKVFIQVRKYYSKNKGTMTFLDFFKSKKGRDREFQTFWVSPNNRSRRIFEQSVLNIKDILIEA